jgi:hypothetical protein
VPGSSPLGNFSRLEGKKVIASALPARCSQLPDATILKLFFLS